ncbi:hypothetical protein GW17_00060608 [Ensete ventricosum]|nr:hypothetical protein GW17_00060608 [Ensete ventricosum]
MPLRQLNHRTKPPIEPSSFLPIEETSTPAPTSNRYWRLLNDPGFSPPVENPGPPPVSVEAFLGFTHQVQALAGMMQTIIPYIPQLVQMLSQHPGLPRQTFQPPNIPRQPPQSKVPQSMLIRGERLEEELCFPHTKDTPKNPNASITQPASRSRDIVQAPPDPDIISSYLTDSVREQLRLVNQRMDEVRKDFAKSKEEVGESSKAGSPFVPEIQDEAVPHGFRLSTLEHYDGSSNPLEHIVTF